MRFKQDRFSGQFDYILDPKLRAILLELEAWTKNYADYEPMITSLVRTLEENKEVGGRPRSAHLDGRAADLRVWDMPELLPETIINRWRSIWEASMVHCLLHGDGNNSHIHININWRARTKPFILSANTGIGGADNEERE